MKYLIITLLLITSCSSERKCRKAIARAEKYNCFKSDSIIIKDTLILTDYDTMVRFDTLNDIDTLFVENKGIKTSVITKWKTREVRVVQKADTIIKERKVEVKKYVPIDCPKQMWWDRFIVGLLAMGLLLFVINALIIKNSK